jgi:hypothetical protein
MIRGFVQGQTLRLSQGRVVADTLDYLVARFLFAGDEWTGLEKWMHLQQDEYHYAIKLTDNETQKGDHLNLGAGQWLVWLHGNEVVDGEVTERITTNVCAFTVEATGALEGEVMPSVLPEVAEQLDARMTALEREQAGESHLPPVNEEDEGKLLQVVGGKWMAAQDLQTAVDNALADAKESGMFDGKVGQNGTSVTVRGVSESSEDGGENIVTFSDGKQLTVKNGRRGLQGPEGPAGAAPRLRVNSETDEWECSYNGGTTWESLGVKATATPAFSEEDKLDPKYIDAEWMATKEEHGGSVELEADISFTDEYASLAAHWTPDAGFHDYDVYWNGNKYTCTLVTGSGEAFLGNRGLLGASYTDTGEPFLFSGWALTGKEPTLTSVKKATEDAETVHVKITTHAYCEYNQLPVEYMTQAMPHYIDVSLDISDDGGADTFVCHEKVARVEPLIQSGRFVRMRIALSVGGNYQGTLVCDLNLYGDLGAGLSMIFAQTTPLLKTNMFVVIPDGQGGYMVDYATGYGIV